MKTKLINARITVIGLALLMFNAGSVLASSITLNGATGNTCAFSTYTGDSSGNLTVTCATTTTTDATAAPVCAPYASVNPISAGGATTLYANCSNLTNTTTYAWTANSTSNFSTASSVGVNPQANTTYSVIATNNVGPSTSASVTVTVSTTTTTTTTQGMPTETSPLAEIKRWNYAFETVNKYPFHDLRQEAVSYMSYNKLIQSQKPSIIFLPTSW